MRRVCLNHAPQGKSLFQPFSIHIFRGSRLTLVGGLWSMFTIFTNIIATFVVFIATGRANANEDCYGSGNKQKCLGGQQGRKWTKGNINLKPTLCYFHAGLLGCCHLANGRKTRSHLISLKPAWEPFMLCRWRVRHNTASLPHWDARNHYWKWQLSDFQ